MARHGAVTLLHGPADGKGIDTLLIRDDFDIVIFGNLGILLLQATDLALNVVELLAGPGRERFSCNVASSLSNLVWKKARMLFSLVPLSSE